MKTENKTAATNCCDGKLVKIAGDKLTSTCEKGDEHQYTVAKEAKITCDGKNAKLADLKKGATIRMTLCKDDKSKILSVESGKHLHAVANA